MTTALIQELADLRGHRSAPPLSHLQRLVLQQELRQRVAACDWCTIGIMAPGGEAALGCLQSFEQAFGWPRLGAMDHTEIRALGGPVFLKGHQRTGKLGFRVEAGLGEGVLLTGHSDTNPEVEDTWGPLPLDFFTRAPGPGATSL
ncbi:MAG: DUF1824 family protein [Cyanobium sp.]|jgi:hypothetical protein